MRPVSLFGLVAQQAQQDCEPMRDVRHSPPRVEVSASETSGWRALKFFGSGITSPFFIRSHFDYIFQRGQHLLTTHVPRTTGRGVLVLPAITCIALSCVRLADAALHALFTCMLA